MSSVCSPSVPFSVHLLILYIYICKETCKGLFFFQVFFFSHFPFLSFYKRWHIVLQLSFPRFPIKSVFVGCEQGSQSLWLPLYIPVVLGTASWELHSDGFRVRCLRDRSVPLAKHRAQQGAAPVLEEGLQRGRGPKTDKVDNCLLSSCKRWMGLQNSSLKKKYPPK